MEPLRPGQCLQPLLLIWDEEKKLVRAEGLGRVFSIPDDRRDRQCRPPKYSHPPGHSPALRRSGSAAAFRSWRIRIRIRRAGFHCESPIFYSKRRVLWTHLPWLRIQFAPNGLAKKARVPMAAGQMCDGPHIYRRAARLGSNPRKVLWGDFARVSAAQTPFRHERSKPKAYMPCRASQISDRSIFVTRFHRPWPAQLWWLLAASSRRSTSALL